MIMTYDEDKIYEYIFLYMKIQSKLNKIVYTNKLKWKVK